MTRQSSGPLERLYVTPAARSAREVAKMVTEWGWMTLDAPYQRGHVWTLDQRIGLVRSWVQGIPIPSAIVNLRNTRGWTDGRSPYEYAVIDGKQRVQTAIDWFGGDLAVPASWFPAEDVETVEDTDDGPYVRFSSLAGPQRNRQSLGGFQLSTNEATLPSVAAEAAVYLLVNGAGTAQTSGDLDNARRVEAGD